MFVDNVANDLGQKTIAALIHVAIPFVQCNIHFGGNSVPNFPPNINQEIGFLAGQLNQWVEYPTLIPFVVLQVAETWDDGNNRNPTLRFRTICERLNYLLAVNCRDLAG